MIQGPHDVPLNIPPEGAANINFFHCGYSFSNIENCDCSASSQCYSSAIFGVFAANTVRVRLSLFGCLIFMLDGFFPRDIVVNSRGAFTPAVCIKIGNLNCLSDNVFNFRAVGVVAQHPIPSGVSCQICNADHLRLAGPAFATCSRRAKGVIWNFQLHD
ncbi:hypothetical protein ANACOL_03342 [Anaerotruncus colihominis DSM 17241]|uniref:Uncharacterized protein n=1 Tax=Anaerotruncus colihominis DSM 17241 TaxID=445972 RepID=B0PEW3_9FIRM|nr:hypothetical protein ANACOL_03342 [Anaerotruncus colihominis DSM 17241]